ncbi:MAG: enoyl-CoA hydratase/isomerase family protein [Candidatus Heimdallarchaeota archaeon]|nr:enoyl-CoA hydratase/isomerase family protein [Candidatus Heimdallarchaeota archaeon]
MVEDEPLLIVETVGEKSNILLITLNRQKKLNALNKDMLDLLNKTFKSLQDNPNIRAVIIYSEGKSWSAGVDLKWASSLGWKFILAIKKGQKVFARIEKQPIPVIAAINGYAMGGGMELALSCDIRIAADTATFAQSETSIGLPPGWGGTYRLPKVVGLSTAKDLIYTGRRFSAEEALEMKFVSKVVPLEDLRNQAIEIAESIARNAPIAVKVSKKAVNKGISTSVKGGYRAEKRGVWRCFRTKDIREGITAVFEKRKPEFKGK